MKYYFFCIIISLCVSCNNNSTVTSSQNSIKNDLEKENLKGDVVLIEQDHSYTFYNIQGNVSKSFYQDNEYYSLTEYNYVDGKITSTKSHSPHTTFKDDNTTYSYSDRGELVALESNDMLWKYFYENGYLISENRRLKNGGDDSVRVNYFYSKNGIIDSTVQINMIFGFKEVIVNYFNKRGGTDSSVSYNLLMNGSREFKDKNQFIYDKNGNQTTVIESEKEEFSGNLVITKITYDYSYDPKGNWIQQKSFVDGKPDKIVNRKIFYKGQDISQYEKKYNDILASLNFGNKTFGNNDGSTMVEDDNSNQSSNNISRSSTVGDQNVQAEKSKCMYCRGSGKCPDCNKVFRTHYWAGKSSGWKNGNETRPGQVMCNDCDGAGVIYGKHPYGEDPESKKCYTNCNNGWKYCYKCNAYGNGKYLGECSYCRGSGYEK